MSWHDAKLFIEELNRHTARTFRLPSEAEREYATRAGTTTRFYWGEDVGYRQVGEYAWYKGNTLDIGRGFAHPVGQKLPNPWGLYDMSGNGVRTTTTKTMLTHRKTAVRGVIPPVQPGASAVVVPGTASDTTSALQVGATQTSPPKNKTPWAFVWL